MPGTTTLARTRSSERTSPRITALDERDSAEAHEDRSWDAWWRSDAAAVFEARERAYRLFQRAGDRRGAARMSIWLGCDHLEFRGEPAVARGCWQRARRLLKGLPLAPEHGWLALHEGGIAAESQDVATARRLGTRAAAIGRRTGVLDIEMLGLALEGLARVQAGDVDRGMRQLDEATAAASAGELEPLAAGWAFCYLIFACETVRDFARAGQWCRRLDELVRRQRFRYWRGVCRVHYAAVLLWGGAWKRAEAELVEAERDLAASRPPVVIEAKVRLAELRRRQGRYDAVEQLLDGADEHPLALQALARLALDRGDARGAAELADRLLRRLPPASAVARAGALEVMGAAAAAAGRHAAARAALRRLRAAAALVGTEPLRAAARAVEGSVARATGDHERARRCFEDAADLYTRSGAPFEAACARVDVAGALAAMGRATDAAKLARPAAAALHRLGAVTEARRARELARGGAIESALTARERDVLRLVARGLGDKGIASELGLSPHTVHRHVANVLVKLGLPSRAAAVAHALEQRML